ncbi:MAG: WD40 repeat domain-containing protein [Chloroflexota bacterium]
MKPRLLIFLLLLFTSIVRAQDNPLPELEPITTENASQIEQLNILGYGLIYDMAWSPDGKTVAVASSTGVILYDAEKFDQAPYHRLDMPEAFAWSVAYSPDGKYLATICATKRRSSENMLIAIRIWDTASNIAAAEWSLELKPYSDAYLAFSPDGKILALHSDEDAQLWDVSQLSQVQVLPTQNWDDVLRQWYTRTDDDLGFLRSYRYIAYSSDGQMAAGVGGNSQVSLWDIKTGAKKFEFPRESTDVRALYFSPDATLLVSREVTEFGGRVRIWDTHSGYVLYNESNGPVTGIAISPKRPTVLIANSVSTVTQFDPTTGTSRLVLGVEREQWRNDVYSVGFSPDGNRLAVVRMQQLEVWDTATGVKQRVGDARDYIQRVVFSPDGSLIATAEQNGMVEIWDAENLRQVANIQHPRHAYDVAFSPDGKILATYSNIDSDEEPTAIFLWSVDDLLKHGQAQPGDELASISHFNLVGNIYNVAFSPDSKTIALTGMGIELWDVQEVLLRKKVNLSMDVEKPFVSVFDDTAGPIAISPDGELLATGTNGLDCNIVIWEIKSKAQKSCIQGHTGVVTSVSFSSDGNLLATSSSSRNLGDDSDNTVRIWDVETGQQLNMLTKHFEDVWQVVFSPNGNLIASASGGCYRCSGEGDSIDGTVRLWGVPHTGS